MRIVLIGQAAFGEKALQTLVERGEEVVGVMGVLPGEIIDTNRQGFVVAAADGALLIKRVQVEGSSKIGAADFAEQVGLKVGDRLGDQS